MAFLFGKSKQLSTSEVLTESVVNTVINNSKTCSAASYQGSNIHLIADGDIDLGSVIINQNTYLNMDCVMESIDDVNLYNSITSRMMNDLEQKTGFLSGENKQVIRNYIENSLQTNFLKEDLQMMFGQTSQEQNLQLSAGGNITADLIQISQISENNVQGVLKSYAVVDIANYLDTNYENKAKQESLGIFESIGEMISKIFSLPMLITIIIVLVIIFVFMFMFKGGGASTQSVKEGTW